MEPDGMLNGSKINERIKIAINMAKIIDFKLSYIDDLIFIIFKNYYISDCIIFFITKRNYY